EPLDRDPPSVLSRLGPASQHGRYCSGLGGGACVIDGPGVTPPIPTPVRIQHEAHWPAAESVARDRLWIEDDDPVAVGPTVESTFAHESGTHRVGVLAATVKRDVYATLSSLATARNVGIAVVRQADAICIG